ncbi:MAG: AAA family ATPase [Anaerolineae bacterium]|nr:AAA family ATPase [Anaerolineae bacterium]
MYRLTPHVSRWVLQRLIHAPADVAPGACHAFQAAIVYADMVGSTPLAESLAGQGPRGIGRLDRIFNAVFGLLVDVAYAYGGDVTHFSGDAVTCMWPITDEADPDARRLAARQACAAALAMRDGVVGLPETLSPTPLAIRLGVGYGATEAYFFGSPAQRGWVLAGSAPRAALEAEIAAAPNSVHLHPSAHEVLGSDVVLDAQGNLLQLGFPLEPAPPPALLADDELLHPFIHPVLVSRELAGSEDFVAEFRAVTSMFVHCDPLLGQQNPGAWMVEWVGAALQDVGRYGGWLSHVEIGGKGNVLGIQFGAPVAHEGDEWRAVACALALQQLAASFCPGLRLRIGTACGRLFAGTIGSPARHAYTLIGDEINLAARLMEMAQPGQVIVSARVRNAAADRFAFHDLGVVRVRGKSELVPVYDVVGPLRLEQGVIGQYLGGRECMVGREADLAAAQGELERARAGQGRLLAISGESGIGKSLLAAEIVRRWVAAGGQAVGGSCQPFARETPYLPWRSVVAALCGLPDEADVEAQLAALAHALAALPAPPEEPDRWMLRLPLLAEVLGVGDVPDNDLTAGLQGEVRRNNTFVVIQALLQSGVGRSPLLVLIEDAHWADDLSLQLVTQVASSLERSSLLLLLVYRSLPFPVPPLWESVRRLAHAEIALSELSPQASRALVATCLGRAVVPDDLAEMVFDRARGHPFFTEEMVHMFQDIGCVRVEDGHVTFDGARAAQIRFPDTVHGVIQARIDQLDEGSRLTLKVASVIGRMFLYRVLAGVYPAEVEGQQLRTYLDTLERLGLTQLERRVPDLEYIFKHSITQDVVYQSLVMAQRRRLHQAVASWYEERYAANLAPYYSLLAYHYGRAELDEHELYYLLLAGDYARRTHATAAAVAYFERALQLLDEQREPARTAGVLMGLAQMVHFSGGQYNQAQAYLRRAIALYEMAGDALHVAEACFEVADRLSVHDLAEAIAHVQRGLESIRDLPDARRQLVAGYARLTQFQRGLGDHDAAFETLNQALALAEEAGDYEGLWRCYRALSIHHHSRGERRQALEAGAMGLRFIEQADAPVEHRIIALNNQACFAQDVGDVAAAIEAAESGLALARQVGVLSEQVILASTLTDIYHHIGDWEAAQRACEEGLGLLEQSPHPYHEVALHIGAGHVAYGQRDWQCALDHWTLAEAASLVGTQQMFTAELRALLAMTWVQLGDLEQAEDWAARGRALAVERDQRGALAASWRAQGMVERARSDWTAGEAALAQALTLARDLDDQVEVAHTLLEGGKLLLDAGRAAEGQALLQQAEEQAMAVSLYPVAEAARELLRMAPG